MFNWFRKSITSKKEESPMDDNDWDGLFRHLKNQISDPDNAKEIIQIGKQAGRKSKQERFHTYLLFERYLINLNRLKQYTKEGIRNEVLKEFPFLQQDNVFKILFLKDKEAKTRLVSHFVEFCLIHTSETIGKSMPDDFIETKFISLATLDHRKSEYDIFHFFTETCSELFDQVTHHCGIGLASSIFHHSYDMCSAIYKEHEAFPYIITILPKPVITEQQLHLLTHSQIEALFLEKLNVTERLNDLLEQEIKEKSDAQKKLKEQELMLSSLISSALDAIITINDKGELIAWNPSAENIFGYTAEEVYGKQLSELIIPHELREHHHRGFARFLATKESNVVNKGRLELPAITKNGNHIKVELTITSVTLDGNYYFNGFLRDITERDTKIKE